MANDKRKKKEIHAKITPGTIQHSPGHYTAAACRPETKIRGNDASSVQAKKVKHDRSSASMVCRGDSVDREGNSRCGSAPGLGGDEIKPEAATEPVIVSDCPLSVSASER